MSDKSGRKTPIRNFLRDENGAVAVLLTVTLPVILGFMTLGVDASYIYTTKSRLQNAADAAALAATQYVGFYTGTASAPCTTANMATATAPNQLCYYGAQVALANMPSAKYGTVLAPAKVVVGTWSGTAGTFTALTGGAIPNAVQVTAQMTSANANALGLFFTPMLSAIAAGTGFSSFNLTATATAAFTSTNSGASGSGIGDVSQMIIATDISGSFASFVPTAQNAIKQCVQDFAQSGSASSKMGLTLFTGNSTQSAVTTRNGSAIPNTAPIGGEQGGWNPYNWTNNSKTNPSKITLTTAQQTLPWTQLTSATATVGGQSFLNYMTGMATSFTDSNGTITNSNPQYTSSGSNIASGMQSAINQFCPSTGCAGGAVQMVIITDGIPNCSLNTGTGSLGTSTTPGQACGSGSGGLPAWEYTPDGGLLANSYNLATYAGSLGITVSAIYLSNKDGANTVGPDNLTHHQELQKIVDLANTAIVGKLGTNALQGQYFDDTTATASQLTSFLQEICVGGANANKPRLVL